MTRPRRDAREHESLEDMTLEELRAFAVAYGLRISPSVTTKPAALAAVLTPATWPEHPVEPDRGRA